MYICTVWSFRSECVCVARKCWKSVFPLLGDYGKAQASSWRDCRLIHSVSGRKKKGLLLAHSLTLNWHLTRPRHPSLKSLVRLISLWWSDLYCIVLICMLRCLVCVLVSGKPCVAVVREEGSNGDREMSAALFMAGFEVFNLSAKDFHKKFVPLAMWLFSRHTFDLLWSIGVGCHNAGPVFRRHDPWPLPSCGVRGWI